jgi:hypothetical protein
MTITISESQDGQLTIMNGHMRLRAALSVMDKVEVYNTTRGITMYVHEVGGKLLAVDAVGQAMLDSQTAAAISAAKQRSG